MSIGVLECFPHLGVQIGCRGTIDSKLEVPPRVRFLSALVTVNPRRFRDRGVVAAQVPRLDCRYAKPDGTHEHPSVWNRSQCWELSVDDRSNEAEAAAFRRVVVMRPVRRRVIAVDHYDDRVDMRVVVEMPQNLWQQLE